MSSQRNTGAFIAGGVLGGLVGAAVTLWKTPMSGRELRENFGGYRSETGATYRPSESGEIVVDRRFSNPVLSFVEKVTAPIVGVDLGKLAKDDPAAGTAVPIRTSSADAKPPAAATPAATAPVATRERIEPVGSTERIEPAETAVDEDVESPEEAITHDDDEGSSAHAASVEDLTSPSPDYLKELRKPDGTETRGEPSPFPDLPPSNGSKDTR